MGPVERLVSIDKAWRRRQDTFWKRVEQSRYGPLVYGARLLLFLCLGLASCYYALEAASTGVVRGRGGATSLSTSPAWFSLRVGWMFIVGAGFAALGAFGIWKTVFPGKKKRANRRRKASVKRPNDHD